MEILIAAVWSFLVSFISIRIAKPIAFKTGLVDKPNERKQHTGSVPLVGGIAIFIGVLSSIKMFFQDDVFLNVYLLSSSIILLLGVLDDKHDLKVSHRLAVQAISSGVMILGANLYLHSLGYILGFFELNLSYFGIIVTVIAVIAAINAFNMVDGIDGLAGTLSIISFLGLAVLFYLSGSEIGFISILFISAILAYLIFNLRWPSKKVKKIFMGDAGSMLIGLTIVWLLVIGSQTKEQSFRPVTALWIIALPLMDMAAIMIRRCKKGQSPFKPDRDHLHHICLRAGLTSSQSLLLISFIGFNLVLFGVIGEVLKLPEWFMFISYLVVFFIYSRLIQNIWKFVTWVRSKRNF